MSTATANESAPSPTLSPNDHLKLLAELMRPGGADLARRWVSALLLVPPEDRAALVSEVERRVGQAYADRAPTPLASPALPPPGQVEPKLPRAARAKAKPAKTKPTRPATG